MSSPAPAPSTPAGPALRPSPGAALPPELKARLEEDDEPEHTGLGHYLRLPGILIGLGLLAASLLGSLVYYLFFRPEPIVLAPEVVVIPLPGPTFEVYTPTSPTDFVAALPLATMTYGLTAVDELPQAAHAEWPARFAEGWTLTYSDGSESTMTVVAVQHYHEEDAVVAFEALWAETSEGAAERRPVMAGTTQVGESFRTVTDLTETIEGPEGTEPTTVTRQVAIIMWRNTTAIFVMTADPSVIDVLFLEYGV